MADVENLASFKAKIFPSESNLITHVSLLLKSSKFQSPKDRVVSEWSLWTDLAIIEPRHDVTLVADAESSRYRRWRAERQKGTSKSFSKSHPLSLLRKRLFALMAMNFHEAVHNITAAS